MSWKLRENQMIGHEHTLPLRVGDWWYCPWLIEGRELPHKLLSEKYLTQWLGKRPPVCIRMPGGWDWLLDGKMYKGGDSVGDSGWDITGLAGNFTASPSINAVGIYHGWIRAGEITDDCEGRKFL